MTPTNQKTDITRDEVVIALHSLEDPSASRVEAVWAQLGPVDANADRDAAVAAAVDQARRALDRGAVERVPTREQLAATITEQVNLFQRELERAVRLPEGHVWQEVSDRLRWNLGDPIESANAGVSFGVHKAWAREDAGRGPGDPKQVSAEVRLHLPAQRYTNRNKMHVFREHSGSAFASTLWVSSGKQWAFQSTDHIKDRSRHPKGTTVEDLVAEIAKTMNPALEEAAAAVGFSIARDQEAQYTVSVYCEKWTEEDMDAGEAGATECLMEREAIGREELERIGRERGISQASSAIPAAGSMSAVWFSSTTPDEDRDHFEQGIDKFYTVHVHEVNGKEPSAADMKAVAALLGVRMNEMRPSELDDGPGM